MSFVIIGSSAKWSNSVNATSSSVDRCSFVHENAEAVGILKVVEGIVVHRGSENLSGSGRRTISLSVEIDNNAVTIACSIDDSGRSNELNNSEVNGNNSAFYADSLGDTGPLCDEVERGGENSAACTGDVSGSNSIEELSLDSSSHAVSDSSPSVESSSTIVSSLSTSQSSDSSPSTSGWVSSSERRSASGRIPSVKGGALECKAVQRNFASEFDSLRSTFDTFWSLSRRNRSENHIRDRKVVGKILHVGAQQARITEEDLVP